MPRAAPARWPPPSKSGDVGALRIALTHSIDLSLLIPHLDQIKRQFNRLEFRFLRGTSREVGEYLKKGEAELGIAAEIGEDWDRLDTWPLFTENFDLVVNKRHPLAIATGSVSRICETSNCCRAATANTPAA